MKHANHRPLPRRWRAVAVFALLAPAALWAEPTCKGPLPHPKARPEGVEKFGLIAQQCSVLAEPGRVHRAAQLAVYDRGASVTIHMSSPSESEPGATTPAPQLPLSVPLGKDGLRVVSLAPALTAAALEHGLDPLLLHAIAHVESRHNAAAVSHAGARGVMQVMPATGRRFGVSDPERALLNAPTNVRAGAAYLRTLRERFSGNLRLMLAAYNAGEGAVAKHKGVPPYRETQGYVRDVLAVYQRLSAEFSVTADGVVRRAS